jgi:hypothetical protein
MNENIDNFKDMVRVFLQKNPYLLDSMAISLYAIADELSSCKLSITDDSYMTPHNLKQQICNITLKKIGYSSTDINALCRQGKGIDIIKQIETLHLPTSNNVIIPSRRALPMKKIEDDI